MGNNHTYKKCLDLCKIGFAEHIDQKMFCYYEGNIISDKHSDNHYPIPSQPKITSLKKSCTFVGGQIDSTKSCNYGSVTVSHGQKATTAATSGGSGSATADCDDGEWKNIVTTCDPVIAKKSCPFAGGQIDSTNSCNYGSGG